MAQRQQVHAIGERLYGPLMAPPIIQTMMARGGSKINLDCGVVLHQTAPPAERTAEFIAALASLVLDPSGAAGYQSLGFIAAQTCATGHTVAAFPTLAQALRRFTISLRQKWAILPAAVKLTVPEWAEPALQTPEMRVINRDITIPELYAIVTLQVEEVPNYDTKAIQVFTIGLVAFCKRGSITTPFANKINNALREQLNAPVTIETGAVNTCWNLICSWFEFEHARDFFHAWEVAVGAGCLRLRLTIQQAQWQGMTNYLAVHNAKIAHPDFYWDRLNLMISQEFEAFAAAVRTVDGNPYYGYKSDLGNARSTLYPNLAYCGVQLSAEADGQRTYRDFQGNHRNASRAADIDKLISEYITARRDAAPNAAELAAGAERARLFMALPGLHDRNPQGQ